MATLSSADAFGPALLDLLEYVAVRVPCAACGQHYDVSLRHVLLSQGMLHDGCPVATDRECPPLTCAAFADEEALRALEQSWLRLLAQVHAVGFDLTVSAPLRTH